MIHKLRSYVFPFILLLVIGSALLTYYVSFGFLWPLITFGALLLVCAYDLTQKRHNILRNYPLLGHLRFILEDVGPELHQYLVESNTDGKPFNRDERSLMYERAKNLPAEKPFGTELDVYKEGYSWITQSLAPIPPVADPARNLRTLVGAERCAQPYDASVFNVSAMSFN